MALTRQPFNRTTGSRIYGHPDAAHGELGAYVPRPIQPQPWHSKKTAASVAEVNTTLAKLAEAKLALEAKRDKHRNADPEKLTATQIAEAPKLAEAACTLFRDAIRACDAATDVLGLIRPDADQHTAAMNNRLAEVQDDWKEKMLASGHYLDQPYHNQRAGGIGGWHGQTHNSVLIAAALADANAAKELPAQIQSQKNEITRGRECNADRLREHRDKQLSV